MKKWKLKRTRQCKKCPWKTSTNPHDIPNGYCVDKHKNLERTIAKEGQISFGGYAMACHETVDAHCVGWLNHQLGVGNNIGLRIKMTACENADQIKLDGPQHQRFEDTLPH